MSFPHEEEVSNHFSQSTCKPTVFPTIHFPRILWGPGYELPVEGFSLAKSQCRPRRDQTRRRYDGRHNNVHSTKIGTEVLVADFAIPDNATSLRSSNTACRNCTCDRSNSNSVCRKSDVCNSWSPYSASTGRWRLASGREIRSSVRNTR